MQFGGGDAKQPKLTVDAAKNAGFLLRAENSQRIINEHEAEGTDLSAVIAGKIPLGNYMQTPAYQKYDQAKRDMINAILRREFGAVISPSEFANAEIQYFPQPEDSQEVIAQKRLNRRASIEGFRIGSGGANLPDIKVDKNAGANTATPIQLESESGIQKSMLGKYVRINGITFKVDLPDMKDYKTEVEKPVSERRDLLDPLGFR